MEDNKTTEQPVPDHATPAYASPQNTVIAPVPVVPAKTSAVDIVWQWLCYGLWSWTLCVLSVLLTSVLSYFLVKDNNNYEFTIYVLGALLCLLPLAFIADKIYSKREQPEKHGFSAVVMVIHAVIIFLIALGSLITFVVTLLSLAVESGSSTGKSVLMISTLVVSSLGFLLFLRILLPHKLKRFTQFFPFIVVGIAVVALIATLAGPFKSAISNRDDKLIEKSLPAVNRAIQKYADETDRLPEKLEDVKLESYEKADAKLLITKKLVRYRIISQIQQTKAVPIDINSRSSSPYSQFPEYQQRSGTYELCVTYKSAKGDNDTYYKSSTTEDSTYIATNNHAAGESCYTKKAYGKNY